MAQQQHATQMAWKRSISNMDMVDDSEDSIAMQGLTTPANLQKRFLDRLSTLITAKVSGTYREHGQSIHILVSREVTPAYMCTSNDDGLRQFIQELERALRGLSEIKTRSSSNNLRDDMWDAIVIYTYSCVDRSIKETRRCFVSHQNAYDDMVTRLFRVIDDEGGGCDIDEILCEELIKFYNILQDYDGKVAQLTPIIRFATTLLKTRDPLRERLCHLLHKTQFADELYLLIGMIGFPDYAYHTFIRAATTYSAFRGIRFDFKPQNSSAKYVTSAPSSAKSTPTSVIVPQIKERQPISLPHKASAIGRPSVVTPVSLPTASTSTSDKPKQLSAVAVTVPEYPDNRVTIARHFLPESEHKSTFQALQPREKQHVVQLIASVLRGNMLPRDSPAWYIFGFVTAQDEEDERAIGGLYKTLLTGAMEAKRPQDLLEKLIAALQQNNLANLLETNGFEPLRNYYPSIDIFLKTREKPTIWYLIYYLGLESGYVEPAPVLKRDYGFQFCRNHQEVTQLKIIYRQIIAKVEPLDLHGACIHGRLVEFVRQKAIYIEPKHRRFLRNDYPNPSVGFDNGQGLELHRKTLFKRSLKEL